MSLPEAEDLKRRLGTSASSVLSDPLSAQEQAARIVVDRATDNMLTAIRSSLDFFLRNAPEVQGLGGAVLSGGGAKLPGLAERFADILDIAVTHPDPIAGFKASDKTLDAVAALSSSSLAVAAGLGLAEVA